MMNSLSFISPSFLSIVLLDIVFLVGGFLLLSLFSTESEFWTHFPLFSFLKGEAVELYRPVCCRTCPQEHCQAGQLFCHSEWPRQLEYVMSYQCSDTGDRYRFLRKPPGKTVCYTQVPTPSLPRRSWELDFLLHSALSYGREYGK